MLTGRKPNRAPAEAFRNAVSVQISVEPRWELSQRDSAKPLGQGAVDFVLLEHSNKLHSLACPCLRYDECFAFPDELIKPISRTVRMPPTPRRRAPGLATRHLAGQEAVARGT